MQRTTWKTCLDGTLATTLSWISKVPDVTKWGKKYDIFLSSLNNSRQNLNPPARRKSSSMSRTFASNEFELLSPASSFAILVWWPFHLNFMNQMRKNYLQLDWLFGERSSRPGHSQDPGKPLRRLMDGWMVVECLDLDGWMVGWLSPVVTDWEYNYLEKYDRNPLWHWVRVGKSMMVVEDHDRADNAARNLGAEAGRSVQSAGKQALNLDLSHITIEKLF